MSDLVPASGTVHWVGTGLSTGSGLGLLCDHAEAVALWGRTADKAARRLDELGLTGRASARSLDGLADVVEPGDVVVSMLPATEHGRLLRLSQRNRAHFACSSYTTDELAAADAPGLVVLTEAGLDPGIDHVLAHDLVTRARKTVGDGPATVTFTSYCGGLPAEPNDFRYRFSWAPRGVLSALAAPARAIEHGRVRDVRWPWEATVSYVLDGESFEVYPNRDSTPFVDQYELPAAWEPRTFVRGTLRLAGWREAWAPVFAAIRGGDGQRLDALAGDLAARYPMRPQDRDRVVLAVELGVQGATAGWHGRYLLDLVGTAQESAMARTVALSLGYAVTGILDGTTPPGLHRAVPDPADAEAFLAFLRGRGIDCVLTHGGGNG
jgi:hypothetical protein